MYIKFTVRSSTDTATISFTDDDNVTYLTIVISDYDSFPLKNQLSSAIENKDTQAILEVCATGKDEEFLKSWNVHPVNA